MSAKAEKTEQGAATARPLVCWNCNQTAGGVHFCANCGSLQPPSGDYFDYLGLPHKLQIDREAVEKTFYSLSRRLHPDVYFRRSEREQKLAEDATARLNDAYRTLKNPVARAEHLLDLEGIRCGARVPGVASAESGITDSNSANPTGAPPELLEEVFELKLALEQARRGDDSSRAQLAAARTRFQVLLEEADRSLDAAFGEWDHTGDRAALEQIAAILNRRSFVGNILRDLSAALSVNASPAAPLPS